MRSQQNRRIRNQNNNNRHNQNSLSRNYESNGPDVKIRGSAQHIVDKYTALARDAQACGDHVGAENYLQHAEHYNRIILAATAQMQQQQAIREEKQENERKLQEKRNDKNIEKTNENVSENLSEAEDKDAPISKEVKAPYKAAKTSRKKQEKRTTKTKTEEKITALDSEDPSEKHEKIQESPSLKETEPLPKTRQRRKIKVNCEDREEELLEVKA